MTFADLYVTVDKRCRQLERQWSTDRHIARPETEHVLDELSVAYLWRDVAKAELS